MKKKVLGVLAAVMIAGTLTAGCAERTSEFKTEAEKESARTEEETAEKSRRGQGDKNCGYGICIAGLL